MKTDQWSPLKDRWTWISALCAIGECNDSTARKIKLNMGRTVHLSASARVEREPALDLGPSARGRA